MQKESTESCVRIQDFVGPGAMGENPCSQLPPEPPRTTGSTVPIAPQIVVWCNSVTTYVHAEYFYLESVI